MDEITTTNQTADYNVNLSHPTYTTPDTNVSENVLNETQLEQQREEWNLELQKTEDEIATLRQVLSTKIHRANDLKHKLGISPLAEIKKDMYGGVQYVQSSTAYQKTNQAINVAGSKVEEGIKKAGRKLSEIRASDTFKSFEGKIGSAYSSVKDYTVTSLGSKTAVKGDRSSDFNANPSGDSDNMASSTELKNTENEKRT